MWLIRSYADINVIQTTEILPYLELYSPWSIFTFIVHSASSFDIKNKMIQHGASTYYFLCELPL